jgi:hypothetical protein
VQSVHRAYTPFEDTIATLRTLASQPDEVGKIARRIVEIWRIVAVRERQTQSDAQLPTRRALHGGALDARNGVTQPSVVCDE